MKCSEPCSEFCRWIETLPHHKKYVLKKEEYPKLPSCFKDTLLGELIPGSVRQLRGPAGSHVHEFPDRWVLHRDIVDAEADPLGHLLSDAPEYLISVLAGLATALFARRQRAGRNALLAGWSTASFMLLMGKMGKTIGEDDRENEGKAPRFS